MAKKEKKVGKQDAGVSKQFLDVSQFLKIVADENRLRILVLLGEGQLNVTDIHNKLNLPQNLTSHHISKLKSLELLTEKREGTFRHYSVNVKKLKEFNKLFKELMKV